MALSSIAVTAWVQPLPTRTLTVSRQGPERVQVTLTGTFSLLHQIDRAEAGSGGLGPGEPITGDKPTGAAGLAAAFVQQSRRIYISVQRLPEGAGDLGWEPFTPEGIDAVARREIRAVSVDTATWRILVEEYEILDADDRNKREASEQAVRVERLVCADTVVL